MPAKTKLKTKIIIKRRAEAEVTVKAPAAKKARTVVKREDKHDATEAESSPPPVKQKEQPTPEVVANGSGSGVSSTTDKLANLVAEADLHYKHNASLAELEAFAKAKIQTAVNREFRALRPFAHLAGLALMKVIASNEYLHWQSVSINTNASSLAHPSASDFSKAYLGPGHIAVALVNMPP